MISKKIVLLYIAITSGFSITLCYTCNVVWAIKYGGTSRFVVNYYGEQWLELCLLILCLALQVWGIGLLFSKSSPYMECIRYAPADGTYEVLEVIGC